MVSEQAAAGRQVAIDPTDGGRWTSLRLAGREWLWSGPGLLSGPRAGLAAFVDAGGLDECFPTVRGTPDHGGLWNQPWEGTVTYGDAILTRAFTSGPDTVTADYTLQAPPGYRFIWAAHALLDCASGAVITAPAGTECRLYPEAAPLLPAWPDHAPWVTADSPTARPDRLRPVRRDRRRRRAGRLPDGLRPRPQCRAHADLELPRATRSTALWRNQAGFPAVAPYRSLGVEPMLGRAFDLAPRDRRTPRWCPRAVN